MMEKVENVLTENEEIYRWSFNVQLFSILISCCLWILEKCMTDSNCYTRVDGTQLKNSYRKWWNNNEMQRKTISQNTRRALKRFSVSMRRERLWLSRQRHSRITGLAKKKLKKKQGKCNHNHRHEQASHRLIIRKNGIKSQRSFKN